MTPKTPVNPFTVRSQPGNSFENALEPAPYVDRHPLNRRRDVEEPVLRKIHYDVFVVFRRWESCKQCKDDVYGKVIRGEDDEEEGGFDFRNAQREAPTVELPPDTYYHCPHMQKTEYEGLMEKLARENNPPTAYEKTVLKDGSVQIEVTWTEIDQQKKANTRQF